MIIIKNKGYRLTFIEVEDNLYDNLFVFIVYLHLNMVY